MKLSLQELSDLITNQESRLSLALDICEIGLWDWDVKSDSLLWDSRTHRLFGSNKSTWDGKYSSFLDLVDDKDREMVDTEIKKSISEHKLCNVAFKSKSGKRLRARGKQFYDDFGKATRMIGVCSEDFYTPYRCKPDCPYHRLPGAPDFNESVA